MVTDSKSVVFLAAVGSGKLNGQLNTVRAVRRALVLKFRVFFMDGKYLQWLNCIIYTPVWLFYKLSRTEVVFYTFIHRTRLGFFLRDLPIFAAAKIFNIKVVTHVVGADVEFFVLSLSAWEKRLVLSCYKRSNAIVVLGENMTIQLDGLLHRGIKDSSYHIIPAFYDISPRMYGFIPKICDRKYDVCFMSNFIREKGVCEFVDAVIYLNEILGVKTRAWIAGQSLNGDITVKSKILLAKQKKYFDVYDIVSGEQKWILLANTKIFVLPTYYKTESLPLSLVDAMLSGCVCVSTKVGEIFDLLSSARGVVLNNHSCLNVVESIWSLLNDLIKMQSISDNASKYAHDAFSFESYSSKICNVLEPPLDIN